MKSQIKKPLAKGFITTAVNLYFKVKLNQVVVQMACCGLIHSAFDGCFISAGVSSDE